MPLLGHSPAKLGRLWHNYLALGQWELAALAVREIVRGSPDDEAAGVLDTLQHLAEHGPRPEW